MHCLYASHFFDRVPKPWAMFFSYLGIEVHVPGQWVPIAWAINRASFNPVYDIYFICKLNGTYLFDNIRDVIGNRQI